MLVQVERRHGVGRLYAHPDPALFGWFALLGRRFANLQTAWARLQTEGEVSDVVETVEGPRGERLVRRAVLSLLAIACIYATHWLFTYVTARALASDGVAG
jgi:hypothetical protein